MSFLQPFMLVALPLISLPIIIHLINQRRYQTINWAAMMFLLAANRMARGYTRLRRWLILLFRMLVIAGLVIAISRPLASGWLGLAAGGGADTTIVLLDRSPSMQQRGAGVVSSKLETARNQLVQAMNTLGSLHWVFIESTTNTPRELDSPEGLLKTSYTEPTSATADLPAMLQSAHDYIKANKSGRTEIWICSDLRENDWNADSGRWQTLRDRFLEFPQGVRFHLLAYPQPAPGNVAVRVTGVRRRKTEDGGELLVSLILTREKDARDVISVPLQFEIEGARTEVTVEMTGLQYELKDYRIALSSNQETGWGKVSIPADDNPSDNECYFAFEPPPARRTIIVADDPLAAQPMQLAASISPDPALTCVSEVIGPEQVPAVMWAQVALVLWQAPLPDSGTSKLLETYVAAGGQVIFFPPRVPTADEFAGVRWTSWKEMPDGVTVDTWRGDQDLLAHSQSGSALPVGDLRVKAYCELSGEVTPLATLRGGAPLLARAPTTHGGVYFCATTPAPGDSALASDGVVFYVTIQRALAFGSSVLGKTRQVVAGEPPVGVEEPWKRLSGADDTLSSEYPFHSGVYSAGERLLAVQRAAEEDHARVLADKQLSELFKGLDFVRVDDKAGNFNSLIQEIWRMFLIAMMAAMLIEASLCLPKPRKPQAGGAA